MSSSSIIPEIGNVLDDDLRAYAAGPLVWHALAIQVIRHLEGIDDGIADLREKGIVVWEPRD